MKGPLVSIITPTYQHRELIDACLDSVAAQTYPRWEQIVVDDGSSDGTPQRVEARGDQRVRLLRQETKGISRLAQTYNAALRAARGELVAILEGDDFWPADKLERMVPAFDDDAVVLAFGTTQLTTAMGRPIRKFIPSRRQRRRHREALCNQPLGAAAGLMARPECRTITFPCSVLLRRSTLEAIGGFQAVEGLPYTDFPTFLELAFAGRFWFTDRVTGFWRQRLHSGTRMRDEEATNRVLFDHIVRTLDRHRGDVQARLPDEAELAALWKSYQAAFHLSVGRRLLVLGEWDEARRSMRAALRCPGGPWRERGMAAAGLLAASRHWTLEPLVRLAVGRDSDQREVFGLRGRDTTAGERASRSKPSRKR